MESYLSLDIPTKFIATFSKCRCSAHKHSVETGILYQQRIYPFCPLHEIKDEYHFAFICPLCSDIGLMHLPDKYKYCRPSLELFYEMMRLKNEYIMSHVMKYLFFAFIRGEEYRNE